MIAHAIKWKCKLIWAVILGRPVIANCRFIAPVALGPGNSHAIIYGSHFTNNRTKES